MAHKGPGMRTPRTRALELGTAVAGFEGAPDSSTYNAQAGMPVALAGGVYKHEDARLNKFPSKSEKSPFKATK